MTEAEAKTKWCPLNRQAVAVNLDQPFDHPENARAYAARNCIASACMMWRQTRATANTSGMMPVSYEKVTGGYCGLAGAP